MLHANIENTVENEISRVTSVPDERVATETQPTAKEVAGTMMIPVGRVRKLAMRTEYLGAFTIGDQLLWGAAQHAADHRRRSLCRVRTAGSRH
ncbi:MAG: hypothetical protein EAZ21_12850 [Betaproteobacteria bacterium]|nr:MAG: hypothetical protein EAZ21_12850 [Betaproteobacteria bacterium]